jgi:hypothetical protein
MLVVGKVRKMSDTSGRMWRTPFGFFDPESRSLRMSQGTLLSDLMPSSPILPKWGWMSGGVLFERRTPGLPIGGSGSSLLFSTPDTAPEAPNMGSNRVSHPSGLGNQVTALLPTPTVDDEGNAYGRTSGMAGAGVATELLSVVHGGVVKDLSDPRTRPEEGELGWGDRPEQPETDLA